MKCTHLIWRSNQVEMISKTFFLFGKLTIRSVSLPGWDGFCRPFLVGLMKWKVSLLHFHLKFSTHTQRESSNMKGPPPRWRPERKIFELKEDLVCKYSNPGAPVMQNASGTLSTANAFLSQTIRDGSLGSSRTSRASKWKFQAFISSLRGGF